MPATPWISVDDRMPEKNIEVLIAFRDVTLPSTGQYTASPHDTWGWCFPSENDPEDTGPITHWMPLPEHPTLPHGPVTTAREEVASSSYRIGYRDGYEQRDAEVRGALA